MKFLRSILLPIVPIYYLVTWFRNLMYDKGWKSTKSYDFPVICVGNLSTGGTGKTPMVEYLIRLLKDDVKLATLSRGYGRKSEGFVLGNPKSSALDLGDEPFQFYNKFKQTVLVAVDANRREGIDKLLQHNIKPDVIVLDDAYQHRKVTAGFTILLTTFNNLYYKDIVLPTGNLREPRAGVKRADLIVVTKCPNNLDNEVKEKIKSKIKPQQHQQIFFSNINYSTTVFSKNGNKALSAMLPFTLVTGIANAKPLVKFLNNEGFNFEHLEYKDHHTFTEKDLTDLSKLECILTTEKDYMRLKDEFMLNDKLWYLPIHLTLDKQQQFDDAVKSFAIK